MESERGRHAEDLASLEQELARLRDEMASQLREYATLMDIKISLDLEIATYRALLEGEEDRYVLKFNCFMNNRNFDLDMNFSRFI